MTILIKKYKNRRLYDMEKSQYVTVDDLRQYVVEAKAFRVEDSTTGQDITNTILLQILVEMQTLSSHFLSSELLRQLIRLAHHPMHQSVDHLLQETLSYMEAQLKGNPWLDYQKASSELAKESQQFFAKWQEFFNYNKP